MSEQTTEGSPQEESRPEVQLMRIHAFKVTDPENPKLVKSPFYTGPKNATLSFGISKKPDRPLRIAYCRMGGSINHDDLEPTSAPSGTDYQAVKAYRRREIDEDNRPQTIIEVLVSPEQEVKALTNQGLPYIDPIVVLTEGAKNTLCTYFGASEIRFVKDSRDSILVQSTQASDHPPSGVENLRWVQSHRCGD